MTADLSSLIERARHGDAEAGEKLADVVEQAIANPNRRVGTAFGIRRKGGEPKWRAELRAQRDDALRDMAVAQYGPTAKLDRQQARLLLRKASRRVAAAHAAEIGNSENDPLQRIAKAGLGGAGPPAGDQNIQ